jgi:hypothetical protein
MQRKRLVSKRKSVKRRLHNKSRTTRKRGGDVPFESNIESIPNDETNMDLDVDFTPDDDVSQGSMNISNVNLTNPNKNEEMKEELKKLDHSFISELNLSNHNENENENEEMKEDLKKLNQSFISELNTSKRNESGNENENEKREIPDDLRETIFNSFDSIQKGGRKTKKCLALQILLALVRPRILAT